MKDQIDAIKAGLAALDTAISQTQAALAAATRIDDIRALTSRLVDLRSERSRLQTMLNNLEAAGVEVAGMQEGVTAVSAEQLRGAHQKLVAVHEDRTMVKAALGFSGNVLKHATDMRKTLTGAKKSATRRKGK